MGWRRGMLKISIFYLIDITAINDYSLFLLLARRPFGGTGGV
jgi:hypothetical protein